MKHRSLKLFAVLILVAGTCAAPASGVAEGADRSPTALVRLTKLEKGSLPRIVEAFGRAEPGPSARQTIQAPLAAVVDRTFVKAGQEVAEGAPLIRLAPSPATAASYRQAESALAVAQEAQRRTGSLLTQHLATAQQLADARKGVVDAQAALDAMRAEGAGEPQILRAPFGAVVTAVPADVGALVARGAPLLDLVKPQELVLRAGLVPEQAATVKTGSAARVTPLGAAQSSSGRVLLRGSLVDPQTGLVPIDIELRPGSLLPNQMAEAAIVTEQVEGFVVPHEALLVDESGEPYVVQAKEGVGHRSPRARPARGRRKRCRGWRVRSGGFARPRWQLPDRGRHAGSRCQLPTHGGPMTFVEWIDRHRRSLIFVSFALALAGVFAGTAMPVGLFPFVDFPRLRVIVSTGSMPAKQMLIEVTEPLETVARAVPGAARVTSVTSRGSAQIFVDFSWGSDMRQALLEVNAAFAQALPTLPKDTTYEAIRMQPTTVAPFLSFALLSDQASPTDLRRMAQYQIAPLLTGIEGVRRVALLGGETPEVQVSIDPRKLQSYGLTINEVANAVAAANSVKAVGRLEDNDRLYLVVSNNSFDSAASVGAVAIRNAKDGIVRLRDIAQIAMGSVPQWLLVNVNGKQAVTFDVYQQEQTDSLALEKEVSARLASFMNSQPGTIRLVKW